VAAIERHHQAVELVADIERLDVAVSDSRTRISAAVAASGTTVTDIFGVGPIVAAMLIGYSGDPLRFTTASRYAAYTGCSDRVLLRWADHPPAVAARQPAAQPRPALRGDHPDPTPPQPGRGYYDRKLAEGKTPREAIRALKRRLSDIVWRHLVADAQRGTAR
jgi:transposase